MKSIFEEMGGTYTLGEDGMYYPNLELPVDEEPHYGKYGRMRMNYIKEHRPGLYTELLFDGKRVSDKMELVLLTIESERNIFIAEQVSSEIFTLFTNSGQRQTGSQIFEFGAVFIAISFYWKEGKSTLSVD